VHETVSDLSEISSIHYTHSSTLRTVQGILGVMPLLGDPANATELSDLIAVFP
jgi:hypothetical protein